MDLELIVDLLMKINWILIVIVSNKQAQLHPSGCLACRVDMISDQFTVRIAHHTVSMNILFALYIVHKLTGTIKFGTFECA